MTLSRDELLKRLPLHEDSFVERKLEGADLKPTVVGLANSVPKGREGVLFIGVRDNGEIVGIRSADALQKKIQTLCQETSYPPIVFTTEILALQERQVLAVIVPPSKNAPHFAGPAYVRQGTKTVVASKAAFADIVSRRVTKAAELLEYKGKPVTIVSTKNRLGYPQLAETRAGTTQYGQLQRTEATIIDVTPFFCRFEHGGSKFSEPLENLTISYDEEKWRPLIVVHLDQP